MQNKERKGKWQPFDALEGYSSAIKKVEKEKMKVEKPILFPDQLEALNEKLASAFTNKSEIEVEYYNRGYLDRKSTRLNSSHVRISYAVFCLKKKKSDQIRSNGN